MLDGKAYFGEFPDEDPARLRPLLQSPRLIASLRLLPPPSSLSRREQSVSTCGRMHATCSPDATQCNGQWAQDGRMVGRGL